MDKIEQLCYNRGMSYELLETDENGIEHRLYPNGTVRNQKGQIIKPNGLGSESIITAESSRLLHETRKEKILLAVEAGVMRVTDAPNPYDAIGRLIEVRAKVAMTDEGRAGNEATKIVLAALDALPDRVREEVHTQRHEYSIDEGTMRIVEAMVRARRDKNIEQNIVDVV